MRNITIYALILIVAALGAFSFIDIAQADARYSKPSKSGLRTVRAYPYQNDVCRLLWVTKNIAKYKEKGTRLIACPQHEGEAISDRRSQGATYVGKRGSWIIMRVKAN